MKVLSNSNIHQLVKTNIARTIKKSKLWLRYSSTSNNIYHCCVHKTASQWVKSVLGDARIRKYSNLALYLPDAEERTILGGYNFRESETESTINAFPKRTIAGSLHINFENFLAISKPEHYKAFFVTRDPRDIVVSWYFSSKYSHVLSEKVAKNRQKLNELSLEEGLLYSIENLSNFGLFKALYSWIKAPGQDENILIFKFEDLTSANNFSAFKTLFQHCDVRIPDKVLSQLLQDYSFEKLTGRKQGQENKSSHLRKGLVGDWKNYFNDEILERFYEVTGKLTKQLDYH